MHTKSISVNNSGAHPKNRAITEKTVTLTSPFIKRTLDICFGANLVSIPRALRVYHVIYDDPEHPAPIFELCLYGDLEGIQAAFADGKMSPFVTDEDGNTLLHVRLVLGLQHIMLTMHSILRSPVTWTCVPFF